MRRVSITRRSRSDSGSLYGDIPRGIAGANEKDAALWEAVRSGQLATVRALAEADPERLSTVDEFGWSLLHLAAHSGDLETVKYLTNTHSLDVLAESDLGYHPLHWAAEQGHLGVAMFLVSAGADVNARNKNGCVPLHFSASRGHAKMCEYLARQGANVDIRSREGRLPVDFAKTSIVRRCLQVHSRRMKNVMERMARLDEGSIEEIILMLEQLEAADRERQVEHPERCTGIDGRPSYYEMLHPESAPPNPVHVNATKGTQVDVWWLPVLGVSLVVTSVMFTSAFHRT